jgi:hypothetical protein
MKHRAGHTHRTLAVSFELETVTTMADVRAMTRECFRHSTVRGLKIEAVDLKARAKALARARARAKATSARPAGNGKAKAPVVAPPVPQDPDIDDGHMDRRPPEGTPGA